MLRKEPNKVYDRFLKAGLGYKNPKNLKKSIAAQPKMYDGDMLHSINLKIDSPDSKETLEDAEESRLKMRNKMVKLNYEKLNALYETFVPQQEPFKFLLLPMIVLRQKKNELEKSSSDSKDIQANLLKRIKILENDFKRSQAQSIDFELKLQHQKDKMACDVSWKSKLSTLNEENIQDLLMTISELKNKLRTVDKGKNVNTKFDKSETSGTLLCVTPLPKNIAVKAKKVSNTKVNVDRLKLVTSHSAPKNEESVESSNSIRRPKSKDNKSKDRVLKNTNDKRSSAHVRKMSINVSIDSNKRETMHLNV
ncbi:hypothetical protein Tco_0931143 [Tanacetum coccineum]